MKEENVFYQEPEEYDALNADLKCPECGRTGYGSTLKRHKCLCGREFISTGTT